MNKKHDYKKECEELKSQLSGTTFCYDEEEHRKLQENYDRIYAENCKLREEHNINDISLLDENYRLKQVIDKAINKLGRYADELVNNGNAYTICVDLLDILKEK